MFFSYLKSCQKFYHFFQRIFLGCRLYFDFNFSNMNISIADDKAILNVTLGIPRLPIMISTIHVIENTSLSSETYITIFCLACHVFLMCS
jgi:outer membrane protein assembly factor BamA